jgi:hypothetical protein
MCSSSAKVFDGEYTKLKSKNLFLFQIPSDLDVQLLNGISVNLKGEEELELSSEKESSGEEGVKCKSASESLGSECQPFVLVSTEQNRSRYTLGPSIPKQVRVYRHYTVPDIIYPEVNNSNVEHPRGLKQRWKPFGWKEPPTSIKEEESSIIPKKKKEKKAKKKSRKP